MKTWRAWFAVVLAMTLALALAPGAVAEQTATTRYAMGDTVEDFTLTTPEGEAVSLSALLEQHKAVALNFWFAGCGPCGMEFPYLEEAYQELKDDLAVLAITPYDDDAAITDYKAEKGLSFFMAQDTIGLTNRFVQEGFPTTVIIDRFGVYCFYGCGAVTDKETFVRLFTPFVAEDYTQSLVNFEIPAAKPSVAMPPAEEMAAALNVAGGALAFTADADEYVWPWLLGEADGRTYAYSGNAGVDGSSAVVHVSVMAQAGDVLAFDYEVSSEPLCDVLALRIDGQTVKVFSGEKAWGSYAYGLEAGEHDVAFVYERDETAAAGEDTAKIDNVRVVSGEAAAAALAANPVYPIGEDGANMALTPVTEGVQEIALDYDEATLAQLMGPSARLFVVDGDVTSIDFRITVGPEIDPDAGILFYNYDGSAYLLPDLETDETAYFLTVDGIDSVEATNYSCSTLYAYPSYQNSRDIFSATLFAGEENVNHFCQVDLPQALGEETAVGWHYVDEAASEEAAAATADYALAFVDQHGDAVPGVIANVCDEETCTPMVADEAGMITFTADAYAYDIHIIKIPDGYEFDMAQDFKAPAEGGEMRFVLTRQ